MQPTGINPSLIRILPSTSPDLLAELLTPGKVLDADVVSVFQDRAILSFGRGVRLEVALQAPLQEGQRVRVQVQSQPAPTQTLPAQPAPEQPAAASQSPVFVPRPSLVVQAQPAVMTEMPAVEGQPAQAPAPQAPSSGMEPAVAGQLPVAEQQPAASPAPETAAQPQQAVPQPQQAVPQPQQAAPQPQQAAPQTQQAAPQPQQATPQPQQAAPQPQQAAPQPQQANPQTPETAPSAPTTVSAFVARQAASLGTGPQQLLRPAALPQPSLSQPQLPAPAPAPAQQPAGNPPPVVLKVIATLPPREAAPDQAAAPAAAKATGAAAAVRETLAAPAQPTPVSNQQPAQQQSAPQVFWLPVPLPDGKQGWAQLHIQEDESPRARGAKGGPNHEVRIWWETPSLGAVQVTLDAVSDKLAALFTAAAPESKGALEQLLPELQRRLSQVGFPEARVGCRTAAPGEAVEPARAQGASRLDKRL